MGERLSRGEGAGNRVFTQGFWVALFIGASLASNWVGDTVWEGPGVLLSACLGAGLFVISRAMRSFWATVCGVLALGFLLLLISRLSWILQEEVLGGGEEPVMRVCLGLHFGVVAGGVGCLSLRPVREVGARAHLQGRQCGRAFGQGARATQGTRTRRVTAPRRLIR